MASYLQLVLIIVAGVITVVAIYKIWHKEVPTLHAITPSPNATDTRTTTTHKPMPTPTFTRCRPTANPAIKGKRVGILAGHSGPQNDPGAVCSDGLREVDINLAVAERVVAILREQGCTVDLLEEFDDRLKDYRADAFLSIHSDSCDIPEATGFKVARVSHSAIPEIEDRLVECLYQEYERATGLPRHEFSITPDMHEYHAFMEIDPQTPGAIIELGFMLSDRYILVNEPDRLAAGIVNGLVCFLEQ
ncbi:MAG: N-acetylmuramoyl-L-alanine amidase family protein [Anaerolineae bacterium]